MFSLDNALWENLRHAAGDSGWRLGFLHLHIVRVGFQRRLEILQRPTGLPAQSGASWLPQKSATQNEGGERQSVERKEQTHDAKYEGESKKIPAQEAVPASGSDVSSVWKSGGFWVEAEALALLPGGKFF